MTKKWAKETLAIRAGAQRSVHGEHSESIFLTSSFVFESAQQAAQRFSGEEPGMVYSRYTNPSLKMLGEKLAALEGAEACWLTASGMAAIWTTCMALLSSGDHMVASSSLFGTSLRLFEDHLPRFGIEVDLVPVADLQGWSDAIKPNTKLLFLETPSNPLLELADLSALAALAEKAQAKLVVDNCLCSPVLQNPLDWGAHVVIHSATKYLDGHGRVLGGAVLGSEACLAPIGALLRASGPTMSAFNAWVINKGLETLTVRILAQTEKAHQLAVWLDQHPLVSRVYYPGLKTHPQYELVCCQQRGGGAIVSFEVAGGREAAWQVIDRVELASLTANLGDTRTTIVHPATTTHAKLSEQERQQAGIQEGLIRLSVGLEEVADLQDDLDQALSCLSIDS